MVNNISWSKKKIQKVADSITRLQLRFARNKNVIQSTALKNLKPVNQKFWSVGKAQITLIDIENVNDRRVM